LSVVGEPIICDVCNENPSVGVASSTLGAMSIAWCARCNQAGAEPWWAIVAIAMGPAELVKVETFYDNFQPCFKDICEATFEILGKTLEDLVADCIEADREIREYFEAEAEASRLAEESGLICPSCNGVVERRDQHYDSGVAWDLPEGDPGHGESYYTCKLDPFEEKA
jgi:hypothetical protein